jgi:general secretion pathway protein G
MKRLNRIPNAGFTLIEILLVIVIIISLMTVLLSTIRTKMNEAKVNTATIYANTLAQEIGRYEMTNGSPPTTAQGLRALIEKPTTEPIPRRWIQMEEKIELDPWGTEYRYEFPGKHNPKGFDIYSCGPDRQPGTDDDVGNW